MTAKNKAKELYSKMYMWQLESAKINTPYFVRELAKQSALVGADEVLNELNSVLMPNPFRQYWQEVKREIEKL